MSNTVLNMRGINIPLLLVAVCQSHALRDSVVEIDSGKVSGWERVSRDGRVYQAWTGIPYAAPPVGELRFKVPRPAIKWDGVLNATGDSSPCIQLPSSNQGGSEDCLYLNVYRPKIPMGNMPVIFHVHGGAFQNGNMGPRDIADYLMDENVVLVGIQYRLNIFGFLSLGDSIIPGNFGLKDQVMALKWVKRNIAAFGGNPNSVTIKGESAGAKSAHILLKSPACDDLVHRAFSDSGTINRFWAPLKYNDKVRNFTLGVLEKIGCSERTSHEILKCMQEVDTSRILSAIPAGEDPTLTHFLPVIEPEDAEDPVIPSDLLQRRSNKPWISSMCTGEWVLLKIYGKDREWSKRAGQNATKFLEDFFRVVPFDMPSTEVERAIKMLEKSYFSSENSSSVFSEEAAKFQGDLYYTYPAIANIIMHEGPKWMFRFENNGEISRYINSHQANVTEDVTFHTSELFYYFNVRANYPALPPTESREDYIVSKRMIKYLVNFAYHSDPTPQPITPYKWKQFNSSEILRITNLGDYLAGEALTQQLLNVYKSFNTVLEWART